MNDHEKFQETLTRLQSTIDDNKEIMTDEIYKSLVDGLHDLFKHNDRHMYIISFLSTKYINRTTNHYLSRIKKYKRVIKLTSEEYDELKIQLDRTNNFAIDCCNIVLCGISDRIFEDSNSSELIGLFQTEDDSDTVCLNVKNSIIFTGVTAL